MARRDVSPDRKLIGMALTAATLIVVGVAWNGTFPLNKRLWTSSFALFTGGISLGLLTIFEWLLERRHMHRAVLEPLLAFGSNALAAYVLSEVLGIGLASIRLGTFGTVQSYLYLLIPSALGPPGFRSLIWSALFVGVCFVPVLYLRRRGLVIKL